MKTDISLPEHQALPGQAVSLDKSRLYRWALILALITVLYNFVEGLVSVWFGFNDETLALFGFGLDSFIEVISGVGIVHLVLRLQRDSHTKDRDRFEKTSLRITGTAFYLLVAALALTSVVNVVSGHKPETTFWGTVVALLSILTMYFLMQTKRRVGEKLDSAAIKADANCTQACLYMSFLLLVSSLIYTWTGFAYIDILGALGIMWFAWKEGQESFAVAKQKTIRSCCGCDV